MELIKKVGMPEVENLSNLDVRDNVLIHLANIERNLNWLAGKTGYSYDTLYSIFKKKSFALTDKRLKKINKALGTTFKK